MLIYFCCFGVMVVSEGVGGRFSKFFSLRLKHGQSDENADKILSRICSNTRELVITGQHKDERCCWCTNATQATVASPKGCLPSSGEEDGPGWPSGSLLRSPQSFSLAGSRMCTLKQTNDAFQVDLLTLKQTACSALAGWLHAIG